MIIRRATADDMGAITRLCWAYRDLLVDRCAPDPEMVEHFYAEADYTRLIADLPCIHARPKGDIYVADVNGEASGCAMYHEIPPGLCEIKRVFVENSARGQGVAQALMRACLTGAIADGYERIVLDTVAMLPEAIALYTKIGFRSCAPFYDPEPKFAPKLRFFEYDTGHAPRGATPT